MIIGISGKKGIGKNLVTDIILYLTYIDEKNKNILFSKFDKEHNLSKWRQQSFANILKWIVSILTGCSISDLEDRDFKYSNLPKEWNRLKVTYSYDGRRYSSYFKNQKEAEEYLKEENCYGIEYSIKSYNYRELLQTIGTDLFTEKLHPDTWVNALFKKYIPRVKYTVTSNGHGDTLSKSSVSEPELPYWIISDVRFKNECEAIKKRDGLIFRVENPNVKSTDTHKSEIDLDDYKEFDEVIINDGTIEELVEKVKYILQKYNIIK